MLPNPVKVKADVDLCDAVELILEYKISGLCVVDDENHLLGIVSEMDCLKAILSAMYNEETSVGPVSGFMTTDVYSVSPHADIVDVAQDMLKRGFRRCPVIQDGKLVGQVTCRQLLRAVEKF
ncbi:MAG: CBS domain-containing protein [Porticoccus sp.]|nr:CBS domain-containing protein [Porticoccus sp.]MBQ0806616.1 CBS domain-containing protein [Porticoccus sp.]